MREAARDRAEADDDVIRRRGLADASCVVVSEGIELEIWIICGKFSGYRVDEADHRARIRTLLGVDLLAFGTHAGKLKRAVVRL